MLTSHTDNTIEAMGKNNIRHLIKQFISFLNISALDIEIMRKYRDVLANGASDFAEIFYDYLFTSEPSAKVLEEFEKNGGNIEQLIEAQLRHLLKFLDADSSVKYASKQVKIGQIHHHHNIEPVWIMGAYHLYLQHLRDVIHDSKEQIKLADQKKLSDAISKFLFQDIGLMLQGYWEAALEDTEDEKCKIDELQQQVSSLLANLPQVLWSVDVINNKLLYISPTTQDICPIEAEMPIPCLAWTIADDRQRVENAWNKALNGETVEIETRVLAPQDETRWFRREFHPYMDVQGNVIRIDGIMEDTTETRRTLQRMEHLANTDVLTGLANRSLWYDRLTHAIASASRKQEQIVLMLLDLNHFKMINDTLGHPAGDAILKQVAARMQGVIRDSDTLARLGGDEFSVLLTDFNNAEKSSIKVANKILKSLRQPFYLDNSDELYLGASIGIAFYPDHGEDTDTLLSHADIAMYAAKRGGDRDYTFYDPGTDKAASHHLKLSSWLRRSIERDELTLDYQPKVAMTTGQVCGVEALIRWNHPKKGLIQPDQFIHIAEQNGMITPITDWVLQSALTQANKWHHAGLNSSVAINISARTFQNPKLVQRIIQAIETADVSASLLEVEITENVLMTDLERGCDVIEKLAELGVRISIDDFGTGYSSLAYLKRLPIHTVKIDKSFVMDMMDNDNDAVIVRSIIDLGQRLGLEVIAEGVENQQTWDLLKEWGCNTVQGFHVSRPANSLVMSDWLSNNMLH